MIVNTDTQLKQSLCRTLCSLADAERWSYLTEAWAAIYIQLVLLEYECLASTVGVPLELKYPGSVDNPF